MSKFSINQLKTEQAVADLQHQREVKENIREYTAAQSEQRWQAINKVAAETSRVEPFVNKPFYVVMVKTNERTEERKPIDKFFPRLSCPTPGYNQDVFKYHPISGQLEYLWSIPRKARYWQIWNNRHKYLDNKELKRLASFVVLMETGELLQWVKKENGEKPDAVIKVNAPITQ